MSRTAASPISPRAFGERTARGGRWRRVVNAIMLSLMTLAAVIATLPLILILFHLVKLGAGSISVGFFTHTPRPVGEAGGGMANAIVGTLIIIAIAAAIGLP
ncbi:MAG: phosphate ABC transporter permease PtsA, partial [Gemmatimonadaceae bacterium]|nr:phosphate ABC transporter permease PtsA [Gemmatimonadaceae bacterium]